MMAIGLKSKLSRVTVNTGARLYRNGYKNLALTVWSVPNVMTYSSFVNVKKYLSGLSNKRFSSYVEVNYYKLLSNDESFSWIYSQAKSRGLSDLMLVMDKSSLADPIYMLSHLDGYWKSKNYAAIKNGVLGLGVDSVKSILPKATRSQSLYLSVLLEDKSFQSNPIDISKDEMVLRDILNYFRFEKMDIPRYLFILLGDCSSKLSKKLHYTFCQYIQTVSPVGESVLAWKEYVMHYAKDTRAKQNLLIQLSKIDDRELVPLFLELDESGALNEKLIVHAFKALNRINDIELIEIVEHIKKKSIFAFKVILEIYRKNDRMGELKSLEAEYVQIFGEDLWLKTFSAKKLIDYGEYSQAVRAFKKIKNQPLYYAVSLLRDKQVDKAYKVLNKISVDSKNYHGACKYLGDINFYEYGDWKLASSFYNKALGFKYDYQLNLRRLKSEVLLGTCLGTVDTRSLDKEDLFYLKYISEINNGNFPRAIKFLNQIFSEGGAKSLRYRRNKTFFDSIEAVSKPVIDGPLVSVVMTAYKAISFIDKAINSIFNQSYKNIELIVIEDHSPDNTYDYINEKYGRKITLLRTKSNAGTYTAKNIGMSKAKGEFITFMDADDWSHPDRISMQVRALEDNVNAMACQTGHLRMLENGDVLFRKRGVNLDVPISLMLRKIVIEKIGYFDSVRASGDSEYINRFKTVYGASSLALVKLPLIMARQAESSLTTSGPAALTWAGMPKVRIDYRRSFRVWHRSCAKPSIPLNCVERPFDAPNVFISNNR